MVFIAFAIYLAWTWVFSSGYTHVPRRGPSRSFPSVVSRYARLIFSQSSPRLRRVVTVQSPSRCSVARARCFAPDYDDCFARALDHHGLVCSVYSIYVLPPICDFHTHSFINICVGTHACVTSFASRSLARRQEYMLRGSRHARGQCTHGCRERGTISVQRAIHTCAASSPRYRLVFAEPMSSRFRQEY